jgi:hypothetical protein
MRVRIAKKVIKQGAKSGHSLQTWVQAFLVWYRWFRRTHPYGDLRSKVKV